MKLLLDALLLVVAICPLGSDAIRIRGSNSRRYDPSNPSPNMLSFSCVDENGKSIQNAIWTRDNGPVNESFVQGGRLTLGVGTENPQSFEDRYYCNSNDLKNRSEPVSFYVLPSRKNTSSTVRHQLEGRVTIDCPLRFGNLWEDWNVEWIVLDDHDTLVLASRYETQKDNGFQLVINNASVDYDRATFRCQAFLRGNHLRDSQTISLQLFHEPEITSHPNDPVIVNLTHGVAKYVIKAYPRPNIEFCYNDTCHGSNSVSGRIQVVTNNPEEDTIHTASFTINSMTEEDNGNVTLQVDKNLTSTVMLFMPYKLQVSINNSVSNNNGHVQLLIFLRRPLYFNYEIEFIDIDEKVINTMEGKKGTTSLSHTLIVTKDTEVMARFKFEDAKGPNSDPVAVEVQNPEKAENDNSVVYIVVAALATLVALAIIAAICYIVVKFIKSRGSKSNNTTPSAMESSRNADETDGANQTALNQCIRMNPINHPHIGVTAPTPGHQAPQMYNDHHFGGSGPYSIRHLFGSVSSDCSSIPSRKSSAGYESATGSFRCHPQYAANYSPRCYCEHAYDPRLTIPPQHYQPQEVTEDEHSNIQLSNSQLVQSTTTNLSNPKPTMRRNSSDPNISRHKQPPMRPLEEQRTKKLLSSSAQQ